MNKMRTKQDFDGLDRKGSDSLIGAINKIKTGDFQMYEVTPYIPYGKFVIDTYDVIAG
jgi:hypothetical protein